MEGSSSLTILISGVANLNAVGVRAGDATMGYLPYDWGVQEAAWGYLSSW